ncbi:MAG: hypothetical protein ACTSU2_02565 [Promethearchaeota archaeon]
MEENDKKKLRFYDRISKKSIGLKLTDEFKEELIRIANGQFPYPVIIDHGDHYSILHLDQNFNNRGTVQTKIYLDMTGERELKIKRNDKTEILSTKDLFFLTDDEDDTKPSALDELNTQIEELKKKMMKRKI